MSRLFSGLESANHRRSNSRLNLQLFIWVLTTFAAFGLLLGPALLTLDTIQEDALITARHARNFVTGRGLVFNTGEMVLGTTAPGWALATSWIYALPVEPAVQVRVLQVFSAALVIAALITIVSALSTRFQVRIASVLSLSALPVISHAACAGMETAGILLLSAIMWRRLIRTDSQRPDYLSVACAAALLTLRLDAVFLIAALYGLVWLAGVLFDRKPALATARRVLFMPGVVLAAFATPWLSATWFIYGQAFPQSMLAKAGTLPGAGITSFVVEQLSNEKVLAGLDYPWPTALRTLNPNAFLLALTLSLWVSALMRRVDRRPTFVLAIAAAAHIVGYALFLTLGRAGLFPWYRHASFFLLSSALVLGAASDPRRWVRTAFVAWLLLWMAEDALLWRGQYAHGSGNRSYRLVGEYLEARQARSVMLEPAGYVGFFAPTSRVLDLGGLTSIEIAKLRHSGRPGWFTEAARRFKPEFVVLRDGEVERNLAWNVGHLFATAEQRTWWDKTYVMEHSVDVGFGDRFNVYRRQSLEAASFMDLSARLTSPAE